MIEAEPQQSHYLLDVLRLAEGAELLVFNGRDGEWLARIEAKTKKAVRLSQSSRRGRSRRSPIWSTALRR